MAFLRTPNIMLLVTLGPLILAVWGCWQMYPSILRTPRDVLTFALVLSAPALLIALGTALTRIRTHNAPLPWLVFIGLLVLLLVNTLWIVGVFFGMG